MALLLEIFLDPVYINPQIAQIFIHTVEPGYIILCLCDLFQSGYDSFSLFYHGIQFRFLHSLISYDKKIGFIVEILLEVQAEFTGNYSRIDHILIIMVHVPQIIKSKYQKDQKRNQQKQIGIPDLGGKRRSVINILQSSDHKSSPSAALPPLY